jgi:pimeloyl-ACP methyl ester carboxylesterase
MKDISIVLLPGLDGTGKLFKPMIQFLPAWIKPVVVSYPVDKPYGYEDLKEIARNAVPKGDDFIILGESFSGPLAIMTAAEKPDGLLGVILCATFAKNPFKFIPSWASHLSVNPIYALWPATIRLRAICAGGRFRNFINMSLDVVKTVHPRAISARVKAILKVDVRQLFEKIDVPVLYIVSRKDHLIKKHNVIDLKTIKPELEVVELNTKHFLLQLEPERSVDIITDFIRKIREPS